MNSYCHESILISIQWLSGEGCEKFVEIDGNLLHQIEKVKSRMYKVIFEGLN